jgi:hypothetical protein
MDRMPLGLDELVERWTVLEDDQKLIAGKRGPTRLGFALLLKFFTQYGRFPEGRSELPDEAVEWVARQVKVPASDLGFYEWSGSSPKYHRAQIRRHFGFRECSVADQEKLTAAATSPGSRQGRELTCRRCSPAACGRSPSSPAVVGPSGRGRTMHCAPPGSVRSPAPSAAPETPAP